MNQSSDILHYSQSRPTGDRWTGLKNTIQILKENIRQIHAIGGISELIAQAMYGTSVANRCNHQLLGIERAQSASCLTPTILADRL